MLKEQLNIPNLDNKQKGIIQSNLTKANNKLLVLQNISQNLDNIGLIIFDLFAVTIKNLVLLYISILIIYNLKNAY
jgi:hypothetical protein